MVIMWWPRMETTLSKTRPFPVDLLTDCQSGVWMHYALLIHRNSLHRAAVLAQCIPPPSISRQGAHYAQMVEMGFPRRHDLLPSLGYNGRQQTLTPSGYFCPRCKTKVRDSLYAAFGNLHSPLTYLQSTELPSTCTVCALPLVSSPHLARSYHHLFPVPPYKELEMGKETDASLRVECCAGCLADISQSVQYRCGDCRKCFCNDCDIYIHDVSQ
jgi:transcription initiation factor TFIIH subunit 2